MQRYVLACALVLLAGCGSSTRPGVVDLEGRELLEMYQLVSLVGSRDGDRLDAHAVFSDTSSGLMLQMQFAIGSPTTLRSGSWRWARQHLDSGSIAARTVTFLGGQDGPPSIGGTFDLLDNAGKARYRVMFPVSAVKRPSRQLRLYAVPGDPPAGP